VSEGKFWMMSIGTNFYYPIYWGYQNFRKFLPKDNLIMAAACALLLPFSFFYLIKRVKDSAVESGVSLDLKIPQLALSFFLTQFIFQLFTKAGKPLEASFVGILSIIPLYQVHKQINSLNQRLRPGVKPEEKFSSLDMIGILAFGLLLLLAIVAEM